MTKEQRAELLALDGALEGCGDHGCKMKKPVGMATNGGCRCPRNLLEQGRMAGLVSAVPALIADFDAAEAEVERLRALLTAICEGVPDVSSLREWIDAYEGRGPDAIADAREALEATDAD